MQTWLPEITTRWHDSPARTTTLKNSHLEPVIFTVYNKDYLEHQRLPEDIPARTPVCCGEAQSVYDSDILIRDLEEVVQILKKTRKKIKKLDTFTILKQRDYNYLKHTGLMVLRHKTYPFVIKLFMETPENLVKPFNRGVEECAFFVMGGGMNRYLAGFTRIPNRNTIQEKIDQNRYWKNIVGTPRKWFWQPKNNRYIEVIGKNIGTHPQYMKLPAIYAIICDAIESEGSLSLFNTNHREWALSITEFLGIRIDPHINNFMIERETNKIMIIDTEHFPSLIGIKQRFIINDFFTYYSRLAFKFFDNKLLQHKKYRYDLQKTLFQPLYPYSPTA